MSALRSGGSIGSPRERVDGRQKVTGAAPYAVEHTVGDAVYLHSVHATITRGRIRGIDSSAAAAQPGVLAVLSHENAPKLASDEDKELWILQSPEVSFRGQYVAAVIAESPEVAREAAALIRVEYDIEPHAAGFDPNSDDRYKPAHVNPEFETDTAEGDVAAACAAAPMLIDQIYRTPMEHNNPMEPHASTALWEPPMLTLYDSTQGVHPAREALCKVLGLELEQVRLIAPYVGGGFGSKGTAHANVVLAALAARVLEGRPVRYPLTRQQMYAVTGYRTPTVQRIRLGAERDGRLTAIAHEVVEQTSRIKEFAEQTAVCSRMMYQAPNRLTSHRLVGLDVPVPSWMRAPGECPGMFAPEVAMDELAIACGIDPVELRIRNEPEIDPESKLPYSSRNLVACLREGARRFGWSDRQPAPRARQTGEWLYGSGVASSTYPVHLMPGSKARVTRTDEGGYLVEIGAADIGTGSWTVLSQIAADALGVAFEDVSLEIGDTRLPKATVAGGSSGTNSWGTAIVHAAEAMRRQHGDDPPPGATAEGEGKPSDESERYAKHAFGAQFVEVKVNAYTGEIRATRMLGIFAAGRIVNPRTARSQFIGGMTMGLGMGLMEESVLDARSGHVVNHDLAEYHVPTNADVPKIEVDWIDEEDPHVNPAGTKGIGEIGIVGTAAALANAAHHATGIRVRELPITSDKLLRA
jgi:xanthine dehydrogenase YagR molybdenum-binding subunit